MPMAEAANPVVDRLLSRMREQRRFWVELEPATADRPAQRVRLERPPESQVRDMLAPMGEPGEWGIKVGLANVQRYAADWDGFTEADFIGPAGSSDPLAFSPVLWAEAVADRAGWISTCAQALLDAILAHQRAQAEDAKN